MIRVKMRQNKDEENTNMYVKMEIKPLNNSNKIKSTEHWTCSPSCLCHRKSCKFSHDIHSDHNYQLLRELTLHELSEDDLFLLLLQNDPTLLPEVTHTCDTPVESMTRLWHTCYTPVTHLSKVTHTCDTPVTPDTVYTLDTPVTHLCISPLWVNQCEMCCC